MTGPWPSERPRQARPKAPKARLLIWLRAVTVVVALLILWPTMATALDSIQQVTDALQQATP